MKNAEENKIMVSNIKAKMFKGYHQIIQNKKKEIKLNSLKNTELTLPNLIYMLKSKKKFNKEYLPFEPDYDSAYKAKYLNRVDDIQADDIHIINLSKPKKDIKKSKKKSKNMFLTHTKFNKNKNIYIYNPNIDTDTELENKKSIFKKIFPDKEEMYKYSELPFFSLTKNPNNFGYQGNSLINLKENDDIFTQEDFLYKLSHQRENSEKLINNNYNKNKGVKRGIALALMNEKNNDNIDKKKMKLMLDIENMNDNKQVYLTSKERRYKIIEKEIEPLKNVISLFKDFETEIEKDEIKTEENEKINGIDKNIDSNKNKKETKNIIINGNNFDEIGSKTTYNSHPFKKPRFYPLNYYTSNQIMVKEKRYEDTHKLGTEEFQKKINLKTTDNAIKNIYKHKYIMDEYEKQYIKRLIKKEKLSVRDAYLRKCRINDIILVSKLKCEFSPKDVKRVLNGIKPWDDCRKLDQKFLDKNLPSKVSNIKTIKFE